MFRVCLLVILASCLSTQGLADDQVHKNYGVSEQFYLGIRVGKAIFHDACDSNTVLCDDKSFGYGVYGGYPLMHYLSLEAGVNNYGKPSAQYTAGVNTSRVVGADISARLHYPVMEQLDLYTRLGAIYLSIDQNTDWLGKTKKYNWDFMIAAGAEYQFSRQWSMRAEYLASDGIGDSRSVGQADLGFVSLGITYKFDSTQSTTAFVAKKQTADANVTEIHETQTEQITPERVPILKEDAPRELEPKITKHSIKFGFDSDIPSDTNTFRRLMEQITNKNIMMASIVGHTDSTGDSDYNQKLSLRRSQYIANYLITLGVDDSLISYMGQGEREPIGDDATEQGQKLNRRVVITIYEK